MRTIAKCLLVLLPIAVLGVIEAVFCLLDQFPPAHHFHVGRSSSGAEIRTSGHIIPASYGHDPCEFTPHKAPGCKRVFVIGESSVHGFPYFPWSSMPAYLQARLRRVLPNQSIEVINAGFPGYTSQHVAQVVDEALEYQPDLIILYFGHNEFMLSHHEEIAEDATWMRRSLRWLRERRVVRALRALLHIVPKERFGVPFPADDLLAIHAEPRVPRPLLETGYQRYERYLRQMLSHAKERGVPVVCCKLVSNLLQQPPHWAFFENVHGAEERERFRADLKRALDLLEAQQATAAEPVLADLELRDPSVASVAFARGRALLALGQRDAALAEFLRAKDTDGMPMRATSRLQDIIDRVASESHVPVLDPWPAFVAQAKQGVPGFDLLSDYCHPNLDGQYLLATVILNGLADADLLAKKADHQFAREPTREEYEQELGLTSPGFADAQVLQGHTLMKEAMLKRGYAPFLIEATRCYDRALRYRPDCAGAFVGRGLVAVFRGEKEAAVAAFARAVSLDRNAVKLLASMARDVPDLQQRFEALGLTLSESGVR